MAPNKFERHIKKQLEEREIKPSVKAWEQLSEKLDAKAPKEKKNGYLWYAIAASFIGLLLVSILFLNKGNSVESSNNQIVETEEEAAESEEIHVTEDSAIQEVLVENDKAILPVKKDKELRYKVKITKEKNQLTAVEKRVAPIDSIVENIGASSNFKEEIINTKILEIVATVDSLEQNNTALTDAEVDDLLRNAQHEILQNKIFDQNGAIDAMALLTEVEDELDQSFRDQIFESLKDGFLKVRTAVADRNK